MTTFREDISDQIAEASAAAYAEHLHRDTWPDDDRPTKAELDRDEESA